MFWSLFSVNKGGEGSDRWWDGWTASPTQWIWVLANSGRQWRTGKPGVLQSMGSQRIRHDLAIKQQLKMKPYDRLVFSQEEEEPELFSFLRMRTQWEDGHLWAGNGIKWRVSLGHPASRPLRKCFPIV